MSKKVEFRRTANLPEAERQAMLDRMDRMSSAGKKAQGARHSTQRKDTRWTFREQDIAIAVDHPGGGSSRLLVYSRNLSAGGLSFIHQGFLYPGSKCKAVLPRIDGRKMVIAGSIASCRHVNGLFHEVGIRFDTRIEPTEFIKCPDNAPTDASQAMETAELHGRMVVIDDNEMDCALLQHHLKMCGVTFTAVCGSEAAVETVKREHGEIVLTELNLKSCDGVELIKQLRESGFEGPIVVITAETDEARTTKAKENGAAHVLVKPYDPNALMQLTQELHKQIGAVLECAVLYSTADDQQSMHELIEKYIEEARVIARKIEKSAADDNFADVRQMCMNLKGSAGGYGFGPLSDLATDTLKNLDANQALRKSISQLRSLCMLCDRLRMRGAPAIASKSPA